MSMSLDAISSAHNFHDILSLRAAYQPDRVAYRFHHGDDAPLASFTYAELQARVAGLVDAIGDRASAGDRVLLSLPSSVEFATAFLACQALGLVAVPVPTPARNRIDERIERILEDATPVLLLTVSSVVDDGGTFSGERLAALPRIAIDTLPAANHAPDGTPTMLTSTSSEAIAFLQYTSGSTGEPKGVCVTNANLLHNSALMRERVLPDALEAGVTWLPMFHDMGLVGGLLQPLFAGFTAIVMHPASFLMQPGLWLRLVSEHRAAITVAPNFALDLCVERCSDAMLQSLDLSSLEVLLCGAEPVHADTLQRFAEQFGAAGFDPAAFCPVYGLAEATLFVSGARRARNGDASPVAVHYAREHIAEAGAAVRRSAPGASTAPQVACGPVVPGTRIVHPETRLVLPAAHVGEIWIANDSVCQGYWQQPDATAATFQNTLLDDDGRTLQCLRTGDLGFIDADELYVTGRIKDLIILRGRNLYPQDIERQASMAHAALAVGLAAAFTADIDGVPQLVVLVEATRQGLRSLRETAVASEVVRAVREAVLADSGVAPGAVSLLKPHQLLRTSSGKVRRRANREAFLEGTFTTLADWVADRAGQAAVEHDGAAPLHTRADIEQWIIARLAERADLPAADISLDRPFVEFGLDSLAAVELVQALDARVDTGVQLDATSLWDYPTIERLLDHLCKPRDTGVLSDVDDREDTGDGAPLDAAQEIRRLRELLDA